MALSIRSKLTIGSVVLFLCAALASGAFLELRLRHWLLARIETRLVDRARAARIAIELLPSIRSVHVVDHLADRLGTTRSIRITFIAADGAVLGDSRVPTSKVAQLENHGSRPEVVQAIKTGRGISRRPSVTLGTDMLYVAIPFDRPGQRGVVRVAMPLVEVDQAVTRLRWLLAGAGLLGLLAAVLISSIASYWGVRTLRRLVDSARALARGERRSIALDSHDELGRLAGSFNRVSGDLERSLDALARERDRLQTVLEGMSEAVLALDHRKNITMINTAAMTLLGLDASSVGTPLVEALRIPALHELVQRPQRSSSTEFTIPGPLKRLVLARAAPLTAVEGTVVVLHDVTEMRHLETMRRDFVANVSHELRTPVSVIQANAETLLLDGALADRKGALTLVEALHRNAERLGRIVTDLLDLSRIEAERYALAVAPVAVKGALQRAVEALERPAARKRLRVDVSAPDGVAAMADVKAIDQVLFNLVDNAIKYTPETGRVEVLARYDKTRVRIEVRDNGPGIEPQHRSRVFERFYRVDPGRSREMGGTGLGLAIVKHLVEAMHGQVGVEPASPTGSVFWVELPAAPAAASGPA